MTDLQVSIFLLKMARRVREWHGSGCAEQMFIESMYTHPELPWKIALDGLSVDDPTGFTWAKATFSSYRESDATRS